MALSKSDIRRALLTVTEDLSNLRTRVSDLGDQLENATRDLKATEHVAKVLDEMLEKAEE